MVPIPIEPSSNAQTQVPDDLPSPEPPAKLPPEAAQSQGSPSPWRRLRWFLLLILVVILAAAAWGYQSGVEKRRVDQQQMIRQAARQQFELGLEDLEAGRYEVAKQRFEYVIELDPTYPQAAEKLAEALYILNAPTATPRPVATPTVNLATAEELFEQAQTAFTEQDWTAVIDALLQLRAENPTYRSVDADGMMYLALRNRGLDLIMSKAQLEQGMYDLSRAERFGPLDNEAQSWRNWAQLYLLANSYVGVNWAKAAAYFAQVYLAAPYLNNDAYQKYSISAENYGYLLMDSDDPCAAQVQFDEALSAWPRAEEDGLIPTATRAAKACRTATAKPRPQPTETPTPGEGELPTATPTVEGEQGNGEGGNGGEGEGESGSGDNGGS